MLGVLSLFDISHNMQCNMFRVILIQIVRDATHSQLIEDVSVQL